MQAARALASLPPVPAHLLQVGARHLGVHAAHGVRRLLICRCGLAARRSQLAAGGAAAQVVFAQRRVERVDHLD